MTSSDVDAVARPDREMVPPEQVGWAPMVVVLGASGGVGASTWAAALARRLSLHLGECVLVDGHPAGGGLDLTCGTEHVPGLRWPDLSRLRGVAPSARLVAALPTGELPLLSADGRGVAVPDTVVLDVVDSLKGAVCVVVDARSGLPVTDELVARAEVIHVVGGLCVRQIGDLEALLARVSTIRRAADRPEPLGGVITRSDRSPGADLQRLIDHLGTAHVAHLRDDSKVRRDAERGDWPGSRGPLRDTADRVVLDLLEARSTGPIRPGTAA